MFCPINSLVIQHLFQTLRYLIIIFIVIPQNSGALEIDSVNCDSRELSIVGVLSNAGKHKKQYHAIVKQFSLLNLIEEQDTNILKVFAQCWQKYNVNQDSDLPLTVSWETNTLTLQSKDNKVLLASASTKKLASRIAKTLKRLKLNPKDKDFMQAYWYVWTESLLAATRDKYNYYIYSNQLEVKSHFDSGRSFAIGFKPNFIEDNVYVEKVIDDNLKESGLRPGMKIIDIKSRDIKPKDLMSWWLQKHPFKYTIRAVDAETRMSITGESIPKIVHSLNAQIWDQLAYIRINYFSRRTGIELTRFMRRVNDDITGIIIDLRFNSGGIVNPQVVDYFIKPAELVLVYQDKDSEIKRLNGSLAYTPLPSVILQNKYSASMSEVFSAMLQHKDHIKIIGEPSLGKAVGQSPYEIGKEGIAYLVESQYFYPDGINNWNETGIQPDITITTTEEENQILIEKLFSHEINLEELAQFDSALQSAVKILGE